MRTSRIFVTLLGLLTLPLASIFAQGIGVGQWRDHLPYRTVNQTVEINGKIYAATPHSLFSYNLSDNSVERLTTISGLSDIGIGAIASAENSDVLVVAYTNGNLDLISGNKIINVSDIKRANLTADKEIYNITFKDKIAYLSCGFGIVALDVERQEIKDTYYIGENGSFVQVNDISVDGQYIYAATQNGVYFADIASQNLTNFNSWSILNMTIPHKNLSNLFHLNGTLHGNYSSTTSNIDTIYTYNPNLGDWERLEAISERENNSIEVLGDEVIIAHSASILRYNSSWEEIDRIFTYSGNSDSPSPLFATQTTDGSTIIGDRRQGLIISPLKNQYNSIIIQPTGPISINTYSITTQNNTVWVASGGRNASWRPRFIQDGIYIFNEEEWTYHNKLNDPGFDQIRDILAVAVDPTDEDHLYAASMGGGVVEIRNNKIQQVYDYSNSPLDQSQPDNPDWNWTGVTDIEFDESGNLWVTNSLVSKALKVLTPSGTWVSIDFSTLFQNPVVGDLLIDNSDYKWFILPGGNGIVVYDDNGTLVNTSDDRAKVLTNASGSGGLPSSTVYSIIQDQDNEIWVGTDLGIAVFYAPENIFEPGGANAQQILVNQDGYNGFLLETEIVTAIAVDGADRKWIGTESSGVFLMSSDGTDLILNFNEENSPLFSNTITTIKINDKTGEVFIGTDKGLIAYKGTATGIEYEFNEPYAYPNPVREGYDGLIAIKGLYRNSNVKITDIGGNLVYETFADGGQATWNGRDFNGNKAQTGIYLVFCASPDGAQSVVTKIMFVN